MGILQGAVNWVIESQIFFPDKVMAGDPARHGMAYEDVWFSSGDGIKLHGWYIPAKARPRALLLFYHGNAGNISHRLPNLALLHGLDLSLFIFDYRGYGKSSGSVSEPGFLADSRAAWQWAQSKSMELGLNMVVFGRSLGGIAAVNACETGQCPAMILESTFTHLGAMAKLHFPLPGAEKFLRVHFNAVDKIPNIIGAKLFFHGDRDAIVPQRQGRLLFEKALEPKEFVSITGAEHNDTYLVGGRAYLDKIAEFTAKYCPPR